MEAPVYGCTDPFAANYDPNALLMMVLVAILVVQILMQ
ncbi:MAG: hypothetical protein CM15mP112_04630 [Flavobacteriales bacterium]|nr:MAG: hypothetical protein CM15mP112_04630 [Flavobacteriales bacterium]